MNRNISLASRDPLPLDREDIYKGMEEIGAYLDVTPRDFQEIYAHAYKIARGRLLSSITAGDIMHVPVLCVAEEQSVRDLVIFLDDHRISGAPVVGADGRLSGVVSESDVVRFVGGGETVTVMHLMHTLMRQGCVSGADLEAPVGSIMTRECVSVGEGAHLGGEQSPPRAKAGEIFSAWVGSCLAIACIALLERYATGNSGFPLLIGSFGASAVLAFGAIRSPLAQPRNLVGGHFLSALVGVSCYFLFPGTPWLASCLAVATAIALMHVTKTLHPPGGATALIAVTGGEGIHQLGYLYAFVPCLLGALIMLAIALIVNNIPKAQRYPQFWW